MFYLIYQEYENGPKYLSSCHRTLAGAEKAKARHLADRFYSAYIFSISTDFGYRTDKTRMQPDPRT